MNKKTINVSLLVFAVTTLANPNVNVFDYLPDFIGYFIIAKALSYFADRAPYFAEARSGFLKLAYISMAKIPAYVAMVMIRGANAADSDVKSLFAFTFATVELTLLILTINNLFEAFRYLGERGTASALISPFPISKSGKRLMSVDALRTLTYIFTILKCSVASLPELLLLTRLVFEDTNTKVFNVAKLYPYVIVITVPIVFVVGIVLTARYSRFFKAIAAEGLVRDAAEGLLDEEGKVVLGKRLFVKDISVALTTLTVASFFALNIRFENFGGIDLLPKALIAVVALFGISRLSKHVEIPKISIVSAIALCAASLLSYASEIVFLSSYSYDELATITSAKIAYRPVIFASCFEFATFCLFVIGIAILLHIFAGKHIGTSKDSVNYSRLDEEYRKALTRKIFIWSGTGILCGAARLLNTVFKYFSSSTLVSTDTDVMTVTYGLVPWFNLVVFGTAALFICYSLHLFGKMKEDVALKYL